MQASDFQRMQLKDHIYHRPDTYVGTDSRLEHDEDMLDPKTHKITRYQTTMPPAMKNIFKELSSNAADNVPRSIKFNVNPGIIAFNLDQYWVEVYNEGVPIPTDFKTFDDGVTCFLPQAVFGMLLTGSNLNDNAVLEGAGRNGFGAKLTNIFSNCFQVTGYDQTKRIWYHLEWQHNMTDVTVSDIRRFAPEEATTNPVYAATGWAVLADGQLTSSVAPINWGPTNLPAGIAGSGTAPGNYSFVYVRYHLDFKRFGYANPDGSLIGHNPDVVAVYEAVMLEYAYTTKVPLYYNGKKLDCDSPYKFFEKVYHPPMITDPLTRISIPGPSTLKSLDHFIHYEWKAGTELTEGRGGYKIPVDPRVRPIVEMLVVCTPDNGRALSYVNCQESPLGGVHVDAAYSSIVSALQDHLRIILAKRRGAKRNETPTSSRTGIDATDIKRHLTVIINAYLPNAKYKGQTKDIVTEPKVAISLTEKERESMKNWDVLGRLVRIIDMKKDAVTSVSRSRHRKVAKAEEANKLDEVHPSQLTLHSLEGDSAMGYAVTSIKYMGRDYNTLFPWRGKILNVAKCNETKVQQNREIQDFISLMGFRPNIDYTTAEGFATLRHGNMTLMTDADPDGDHIRGLAINVIAKMFPTYFQSPMANIFFYVTPLVRVGDYSFYTEEDAQQFMAENPGLVKGLKVRYMKGLGTSNKDDVRKDFQRPLFARVVYDAYTPELLRLSFGKMDDEALRMATAAQGGREAMTRQQWLLTAKPQPIDPRTPHLTVSAWINYAVRSYFVYTFRRAIPDAIDCLKEGQRKVLYTVLVKARERTKVNHLGSTVSKFTDYHHGEKSLEDTIKWLAQDFVGSNNLNYLKPDGQFGTINQNGKDAADGRYSYTQLRNVVKKLVDMEFLPYIERVKHGEFTCEAKYIPFVIAPFYNGFNGIAAGWSTYCPNYHPMDMVELTKHFIYKKVNHPYTVKLVTPFYKGFTGTIEITNANPDEPSVYFVDEYGLVDHKAIEALRQHLSTRVPRSMRTYGVYQVMGPDKSGATIRITSLPIGVATASYKEWLDEMINLSTSNTADDIEKRIENGITLKRYDNQSDDEKVEFTLFGVRFVKAEYSEGKQKTKTAKGSDLKTTSGETTTIIKEVFEPALTITHKQLRLVNNYGLTNIHLLGPDGVPKHFDGIYEMVENFVNIRYPDYERLVKIRQEEKKEEIEKLSIKVRYIKGCIDKIIILEGMNKAQARDYITNLGYPEEMLRTTQLDCTADGYEELVAKLTKLTAEYEELLKLHPGKIWMDKIDAFVAAYNKSSTKQKGKKKVET